MSIIFRNLNHSFICLVPDPFPDSGFRIPNSGFSIRPYLIYYKMQRKIYSHQCFLRLLGSSQIGKGRLEILFQNTLNNAVLNFYDNYA